MQESENSETTTVKTSLHLVKYTNMTAAGNKSLTTEKQLKHFDTGFVTHRFMVIVAQIA